MRGYFSLWSINISFKVFYVQIANLIFAKCFTYFYLRQCDLLLYYFKNFVNIYSSTLYSDYVDIFFNFYLPTY